MEADETKAKGWEQLLEEERKERLKPKLGMHRRNNVIPFRPKPKSPNQ